MINVISGLSTNGQHFIEQWDYTRKFIGSRLFPLSAGYHWKLVRQGTTRRIYLGGHPRQFVIQNWIYNLQEQTAY